MQKEKHGDESMGASLSGEEIWRKPWMVVAVRKRCTSPQCCQRRKRTMCKHWEVPVSARLMVQTFVVENLGMWSEDECGDRVPQEEEER